jgi:xylulose-5-phosphate/fructose-6-phosphate phosphoketolase
VWRDERIGRNAGEDRYLVASSQLSVSGQNLPAVEPMLRKPFGPQHIKPRLLGHWGTPPGLNLICAHMNRGIEERDLNAIFITSPGHGGPAVVASTYLEGTYSETYPEV